MAIDFQKKLEDLLKNSQLIKSIRTFKQYAANGSLTNSPFRILSEKEIELLARQDNLSQDWSKIRVASGFRTDFIRGNTFSGECVLGVFSGIGREIARGVFVPDGIYDSTIVCCEIRSGCCIKDCSLIANYYLGENAVIFNVGSINAQKGCTFGNGMRIPVGMETGGREVASCAEIDITIAELVAMKRHDKKFLEYYDTFVKNYCERIIGDFGIIEASASIRNTSEINNTYIGENARIDGATIIENSTILSEPKEKTEINHGAIVKNSCVQWGCEISSLAIVTDSIITEHSRIERHGKVTASIIGPNSVIAEGEVTSCLIGPFVAFHHQALLIAALWPEGKGNVAYGANVGSNHTSRAPDQEIFCGEGAFFGLGTTIKFPSDFSQAPYSIFATGLNTMPQRIEFPFSLIQSPSRHFADALPAYNEIVPAWVLSNNIYMLLRNEKKFKQRNKAKRTQFELTVFRPDIIEKMLTAKNKLCSITVKKNVYSDKDIPGIGKNVLREEKRIQAINAYVVYIEYYCLMGLKDRIAKIINSKEETLDSIYREKTEDSPLWKHQKGLLKQEGFDQRNLKDNLTRLISILETITRDALLAKEKDDVRGLAIIPDFLEAYKKASQDSFINEISLENGKSVKKIRHLSSLV